MRITAIEKQERRSRVNISVDGVYRLSLSLAVLADAALRLDDEITNDDVTQLENLDARYVAYQAALRLLSYRPRSEQELRRRLKRRAIAEPHIDETIEKLKRQGYIDDVSFAQSWVASRNQASPRGKRLLTWELRAKGVAPETAQEAAQETSDDDAAYRAALKKVRSLSSLDAAEFRRRLGEFLVRRGFAWGVVRQTTDRIWAETRGTQLDDDENYLDGSFDEADDQIV
jgi:regulatory protein